MLRVTPLRAAALGAAGFAGSVAYVSHKYRYHPSWDVQHQLVHLGEKEWPTQPVERFLLKCGQWFVLSATAKFAQGAFAVLGNEVEVVGKEKLDKYLAEDRDWPVLTYTNHHSILDSPVMETYCTPAHIEGDPERMRTAFCTEEMCFASFAPATFFSNGKVPPIQRGGSMYQSAMAEVTELMRGNEWINIYPEGRTWQEHCAPGRDEQGRWCLGDLGCGEPWSKVGPFRWGIGKVIANSPKLPLIVPIFHMGMNKVMPQDADNNIVGFMPQGGQKITITVGDPVDVKSILDAYHAKCDERVAAREVEREKSGLPRSLAEVREMAEAGTLPGGLRNFPAAAARLVDAPAVDGTMGVVVQLKTKSQHVHGLPHPDPKKAAAGFTVIPPRRKPDGTLLMPFTEGPLQARPADHVLLTTEEHEAEHQVRLRLYKELTDAVHAGMVAVEKQAREHRRAQGLGELDDDQG